MFLRHPKDAQKDSFKEFSAILRSIQERLPIAPSDQALRWFLANGSSLSLEMGGSADLSTALIEVATPETRSPREVVCYQLANEQLLQEALEANRPVQTWSLIKSNSDAYGHTLGQHESYDMRIAQGPWLLAWWIGLTLLLLPLIVYRCLASLWLGSMLLLSLGLRGLRVADWGASKSSADKLDPLTSSERLLGFPMAPWQWLLGAWGLRQLHAPIVWLFGRLLSFVALRPHRRNASAFLATRCLLDGAGYLDPESKFWISSRAALVDREIGFGSYNAHRPMFRCDPLLRKLLSGPYWSLANFFELLRPIQRIEIAIGDSGMCQQSQWLRIGSTALVLDWIEQNRSVQAIQLRSATAAIREYARDWMLVRSMPDRAGVDHKSRDISRIYLRTLKSWLEKKSDVPREAWEIIELWQMTLNQIEAMPKNQNQPPMLLVGRIDWISKLWLLQQLGKDTDWSVKKKIDIRYHELSFEGYFRQLIDNLQLSPLISEREIQRSMRMPPADSPAWRRGNWIREFADSESKIVVGWEAASYELDGENYRVEFRR
ncbi:MAG: proteasome accessory factor PafA2 family protein [Planctomycetota bacterium]|nr:proteasome accessory factor PafA2 family protein [Planctomycetota bacterium]